MPRTFAWFLVLVLIVGACSPDDTDDTSTSSSTPSSTSTTTTTTSAPTTTTSDDAEVASLVNGLPVEDPSLLDRQILAVKIDNHFRARPQSGIDQADMVIELMVEGITRFLTIWHESDSDYLGPNRSGRPTDASLLAALNEPTFTISGAQDWVQSLIVSKGVHLIGEVKPATFRISARSAPHDLYVDTNLLREYAETRGYPSEPPEHPLWQFGEMAPSSTDATTVLINFSGNRVTWEWDETENAWLRVVGGKPSNIIDREGVETQISRPVLIALYVEQYTVSPPAGVAGTALPSSRTTGTGRAFVFAEGKVVEGTWERETEEDWFVIRQENGDIIPIPVGKSWLSLVPDHTGLIFE